MCSKRRGSHGGGIRPPTTPSPKSASPSSSPNISNPHSSFFGWYPDTYSGRRRAQLHGACKRDTDVHASSFSHPPHPAPHTTQFCFHSTIHRLFIIAQSPSPFLRKTTHRKLQQRIMVSGRGPLKGTGVLVTQASSSWTRMLPPYMERSWLAVSSLLEAEMETRRHLEAK